MSISELEKFVEAERNKPRLSNVTFYGECRRCDNVMDITPLVDSNRKLQLIDTYGVEKRNEKWVCKFTMPLENCPKCAEI